jgi:hypothetical protein
MLSWMSFHCSQHRTFYRDRKAQNPEPEEESDGEARGDKKISGGETRREEASVEKLNKQRVCNNSNRQHPYGVKEFPRS